MGQVKQLVHSLNFSFNEPVSLTKNDRSKIAHFIALLAKVEANVSKEEIIGWSSEGSNAFHLKVDIRNK
jgi:hypothetical protein